MEHWREALLAQWHSLEAFGQVADTLRTSGRTSVSGLQDGAKRYFAAALARELRKSVLMVVHGEAAAALAAEEMQRFFGAAMHLPTRENQLRLIAAESPQRRAQRITALQALQAGEPCLVVASVEALMQRLCPPEVFEGGGVWLRSGQSISPRTVISRLTGAGYERLARAEGPGQCALRGGILDIVALQGEEGVRIEFFADEIDSLRGFDLQTQRSTRQMTEVYLPPASELPLTIEAAKRGADALKSASTVKNGFAEHLSRAAQHALAMTPFAGMENLMPLFYERAAGVLDYLHDAVVLLDEPARLEERMQESMSQFHAMLASHLETGDALGEQADMLLAPDALWNKLRSLPVAALQALPREFAPLRFDGRVSIASKKATMFNGNIQLVAQECLSARKQGYASVLLAGGRAEQLVGGLSEYGVEAALADTFSRELQPGEVLLLPHAWPSGFTLPALRLTVLCEVEIFGQQKRKARSKPRVRGMELFADLKIGDYVVHEAHGIGKFVGMEKLTVEDKSRDYLCLLYLGGDKLFVPTDQLDRVQKYIGAGEEGTPRLTRMGGAEWKKTLTRVRESVKALAVDLAALYAKRQTQQGIAFAPDTVWQRQLEERFPYEETPDQMQCITEVKRNMESDKPMDRLLCGDVGYGKTEVAVRAAFKAVMDGYQVAFLVPTTILAEQHYQTLCARFEGFPVKVALLSRFCTQAQQRETLKLLREGNGVDVVVGTHRLLGKDVRFRKLGLLIVDEEQRFGVGHKEQIKALRENVDVLTLSATPIPRTLQLSLVGLRDMSVIETPPEDRFPVDTYVLEYTDELAREAIEKELQRGGQTFFVYNHVQQMERFAHELQRLTPQARIAMAHGQMPERQLEHTMLDFLAGNYDVLLCSTIIESGLDIANVNTIIVYDADRMGLSQLYQLRGRVGRSSRQGYAYLTFRRDKALSEIAEKRLMAIREFTEFGAGFKIAMRDLEIRGAGNLLGPEQHGHLSDVGYDMYCRLVEAAVRAIKGEQVEVKIDTLVEIPLDAHIPHAYIPDEMQRLEIYKRIAAIASPEERSDVLDELIDRFGDVPGQVVSVMDIALYKAYASRACITLLKVQPGEARMTLHVGVQVDTSLLFALLSEYQGRVSLSATTPAVLILRQKGADIPAILALYDTFVHKLFDCVSMGNTV